MFKGYFFTYRGNGYGPFDDDETMKQKAREKVWADNWFYSEYDILHFWEGIVEVDSNKKLTRCELHPIMR